ncbi:recQ-mediated genome instability protein 1 isoform X2 [Cajanus cajan]|uniref:recQ-mediated genome instability protein 1 isoform X2 n=1 Tax=Cajanus cajan TaxID=3821 RepID=UPI00098DCC3A|nr:recQ-mediated genome instability protein 1 isoform X2 [Cajanus cajan]
MPVRRLRLDSDSDEEQQHPLQPRPVEISDDDDDDFIDVADSLSPPSPASACPISDHLRRLGLSLRRDWLASCLLQLQSSVAAFQRLDAAAKAKLCFEHFLFADMNSCGAGVLPPDVDSMHLRLLPGPYVLQVDEVINICCPLRGRYEAAPAGLKRCLKLSMTDGVQRVFGMEYRPIKALEVCASSGSKVVISNVHVRRGLLMLVPETIVILGGLVEQLDAARKRLVEEINKPPRGKRTKNGVLPPLATRATLAAWPSGGVDDLGRSGFMPHGSHSVQENNQGASLSMSGTGNSLTTEDTVSMGAQNTASNSILHMASNAEAINMNMRRDSNPVSRVSPMANQLSSVISKAEEMHIDAANLTRETSVDNHTSHMDSNVAAAHMDSVHIARESYAATECTPIVENVETDRDRTHVATDSARLRRSSPAFLNVAATHKDTVHITRESSVVMECSPIVENVDTDRDRTHLATDTAHPRRSSPTILNTSDVDMVDASDHPLIMSGDQEVPFTYLASLSAKLAAMKEGAPFVRGKIKCFLTGVKGFQYKKRATYELQAYVDDGSLISEILIDHDGIILVELNKKSSLPLALEMSQGCPQSDAWLLLRRLKSLHPPQVQEHFSSDPIELSP